MFRNALSVLALTGVLALGGAGIAHASAAPELTASPESIEVGAESTITATGLGGLETASFGLDGTPGGMLIDAASGQEATSIEAAVSNGSATVRFTATEAGTFTVAVGTGETVAATTLVTVTAASSSPSASPQPTVTVTSTVTAEPSANPSPSPAPATDGFPSWAVWLIVLGVLLVAAVVVIIVLVVRRRGSRGPSA